MPNLSWDFLFLSDSRHPVSHLNPLTPLTSGVHIRPESWVLALAGMREVESANMSNLDPLTYPSIDMARTRLSVEIFSPLSADH